MILLGLWLSVVNCRAGSRASTRLLWSKADYVFTLVAVCEGVFCIVCFHIAGYPIGLAWAAFAVAVLLV